MSNQENISLVKKLFEIYNKNNASSLNEFESVVASNVQVQDSSISKSKTNLDGLKTAETTYIRAFPNKKTTIEEVFATDDGRVAVRYTTTGTQKGEFQGIAPSNKEFRISGIALYKVSNGKIVDLYQIWDRQGLIEQLGKGQMAHSSR